ncbi:PLD nuclease N-terminal domain-containing protein [Marinicrinis lubricantis]|uniref:PLD nuclease N-terminal domain-containing protein n=1 Tax=Marinicrinis lubricantis TaxID=2086470 RepID=A0ABW1ITU4_9BACL
MNLDIQVVPWEIVGPVLALQFILQIVALISLWKTEDASAPKWIWAVVIVIGTLLGTVAYFIFGRRNEG